MKTATWIPQAIWSVPPDWIGERCFVICGGESVRAQRYQIAQLRGRIIGVKHGVLLRPDADVLFIAGERAQEIVPPLLKVFRGQYIVVRGKGHPAVPDDAKRVVRPLTHTAWCDDPTMVAGYDAGTSAINLAMNFGAMEIILLGYDMVGGRWFNGELPHYLPYPKEAEMQIHMSVLPALAKDAERRGVRIVNCSPISRVDCFERQPLEAFL